MGDLLKQGFQLQEMLFKAFTPDKSLCPVIVLQEYLDRTETVRQDPRILITLKNA